MNPENDNGFYDLPKEEQLWWIEIQGHILDGFEKLNRFPDTQMWELFPFRSFKISKIENENNSTNTK